MEHRTRRFPAWSSPRFGCHEIEELPRSTGLQVDVVARGQWERQDPLIESVEVEVPYATETTPKTYKPDRAFRNPELRDALLTVAGGKIDIGVFGQLDQEARRTRGRYGRRPLLHDRKRTDVRRQRQVESRRDEIKMKWV